MQTQHSTLALYSTFIKIHKEMKTFAHFWRISSKVWSRNKRTKLGGNIKLKNLSLIYIYNHLGHKCSLSCAARQRFQRLNIGCGLKMIKDFFIFTRMKSSKVDRGLKCSQRHQSINIIKRSNHETTLWQLQIQKEDSNIFRWRNSIQFKKHLCKKEKSCSTMQKGTIFWWSKTSQTVGVNVLEALSANTSGSGAEKGKRPLSSVTGPMQHTRTHAYVCLTP